MEWFKFVEWAFLATLSGSVIWCSHFLSKIAESINHLNSKIAVMMEKLAWHEKELNNHDYRINDLEQNRYERD